MLRSGHDEAKHPSDSGTNLQNPPAPFWYGTVLPPSCRLAGPRELSSALRARRAWSHPRRTRTVLAVDARLDCRRSHPGRPPAARTPDRRTADAPAARMMREHSQSISAQNGSNPPVIASLTQHNQPAPSGLEWALFRDQEPDGNNQMAALRACGTWALVGR